MVVHKFAMVKPPPSTTWWGGGSPSQTYGGSMGGLGEDRGVGESGGVAGAPEKIRGYIPVISKQRSANTTSIWYAGASWLYGKRARSARWME